MSNQLIERTQEQKRVKIAEAVGYSDIKRVGSDGHWVMVGDKPGYDYHMEIPDYFGDLNACAKMEEALVSVSSTKLLFDYYELLQSMMGQEAISASASQRAEAFGVVLKLW